jgi:hypothetical protein
MTLPIRRGGGPEVSLPRPDPGSPFPAAASRRRRDRLSKGTLHHLGRSKPVK